MHNLYVLHCSLLFHGPPVDYSQLAENVLKEKKLFFNELSIFKSTCM